MQISRFRTSSEIYEENTQNRKEAYLERYAPSLLALHDHISDEELEIMDEGGMTTPEEIMEFLGDRDRVAQQTRFFSVRLEV